MSDPGPSPELQTKMKPRNSKLDSDDDPTSTIFTNTLFNSQPITPDAPLPAIPPAPTGLPFGFSTLKPHFGPLPAALYTTPNPPLSFVHRPVGAPFPDSIWDPASAIRRGDLFHLKQQWSTELHSQHGRVMFGMNAQGPPGNAHGGSIAAICDDIVGTTGGLCLLQMHLEDVFRKLPAFKDVPPDNKKYISLALDRYYSLSDKERAAIKLHPRITLEELEKRRDKLIPYSPEEIAFIMPAISNTLRVMPTAPGSSSPPAGLVAEISCRLKRRVPLLTRLAVRGRATKVEGKRIHVVAEIWGKKSTRMSALEPDESGGWEGEWDVLLAEGQGTLAVMYGYDLVSGKTKI